MLTKSGVIFQTDIYSAYRALEPDTPQTLSVPKEDSSFKFFQGVLSYTIFYNGSLDYI